MTKQKKQSQNTFKTNKKRNVEQLPRPDKINTLQK